VSTLKPHESRVAITELLLRAKGKLGHQRIYVLPIPNARQSGSALTRQLIFAESDTSRCKVGDLDGAQS
jgi:hypothetical protein